MATKIRIILVAVLMAATFLCSCRSKEAVTKETAVSKIESRSMAKDSISTKESYLSEDTTYSNEVTTIHHVEYDTSKAGSDGRHPVKSTTDITKKSQAGSKGKASQSSTITQVQTTKKTDKQKTTTNKQANHKVTSQVKEVNSLITNIIWFLFIITAIAVVIFLSIKYRSRIRPLLNKILSLLE
jgi:hypothetical protein